MASRQPISKEDLEASLKIMDAIANSSKAEFPFNLPSGEPPYALYNPNMHPELEGEIIWLCARDSEEHLISLFRHTLRSEVNKDVSEVTVEEAKHVRDELVQNGWLNMKPPNITFTPAEADKNEGGQRPKGAGKSRKKHK